MDTFLDSADPKLAVESISEVLRASKIHLEEVNRPVPYNHLPELVVYLTYVYPSDKSALPGADDHLEL